jgi:hypothetical protein
MDYPNSFRRWRSEKRLTHRYTGTSRDGSPLSLPNWGGSRQPHRAELRKHEGQRQKGPAKKAKTLTESELC